MYYNGSGWKTPSSLPDTNDYNVFFRNGVDCKNFNSSWNKVVTFSASQKIKSGTLTVDTGTALSAPVTFSATATENGLTATASALSIGRDTATKYGPGYLQILSGTYAFQRVLLGTGSNKGWLKVGDGTSSVSFTAKSGDSALYGTSEFIADNATLDFSGRNFNMYDTSSVDIKDSTMTAAIINVAVNENNNCTAVFNGGSLTLSSSSDIGYGKNSKGYMYATNLTLTVNNASLQLGGHSSGETGATGLVDKKGGDWTIGGNLLIGAQASSTGTFTTDGGSVTVL